MVKIDGGYIILARKILNNSSWQGLNEAGKVIMITLIELANHKDRKWYNPLTKQEVLIKRGQCVTGRKSLAKQCNIGEQSVRTALTLLKSTNFLTIEPTSRFSIITICNYEYYQNPKNYTNQVFNQEDNQPPTKSQPSPNQVLTTNNELNNVNNNTLLVRDYFYASYKQVFKKDYVANFGKDGKIFKDLLVVIPLVEIKSLIDKFFASEDKFIKKSGYTTNIFTSQINKLRQVVVKPEGAAGRSLD